MPDLIEIATTQEGSVYTYDGVVMGAVEFHPTDVIDKKIFFNPEKFNDIARKLINLPVVVGHIRGKTTEDSKRLAVENQIGYIQDISIVGKQASVTIVVTKEEAKTLIKNGVAKELSVFYRIIDKEVNQTYNGDNTFTKVNDVDFIHCALVDKARINEDLKMNSMDRFQRLKDFVVNSIKNKLVDIKEFLTTVEEVDIHEVVEQLKNSYMAEQVQAGIANGLTEIEKLNQKLNASEEKEKNMEKENSDLKAQLEKANQKLNEHEEKEKENQKKNAEEEEKKAKAEKEAKENEAKEKEEEEKLNSKINSAVSKALEGFSEKMNSADNLNSFLNKAQQVHDKSNDGVKIYVAQPKVLK